MFSKADASDCASCRSRHAGDFSHEVFAFGPAASTEEMILAIDGSEQGGCDFAAWYRAALTSPAGPADRSGLEPELERKRERQRIAGLLALCERKTEEIDELVYAVTHDLNEPLRKVSSFCKLLETHLGDALDDKGREFLGHAVGGADRMKQLLDDLVSLSRAGACEGAVGAVRLEDCVDRIRQRLARSLAETGARLDVDAPVVIQGYEAPLTRLLQQLVENALKFRGDRPPVVRISAQRDVDAAEWVLEVADNGIGIAPNQRDRVFGVFQRLHARDAFEGTGIGLAICKRIVEQRGGRIWIEESSLGGIAVRVALPDLAD